MEREVKHITKNSIRDMQTEDRPRERLADAGAQYLTTAQLLAVLLRVGVRGENAVDMGQRLLNDLGGLDGIQRTEFIELVKQHGMGKAKAAQIKAAIELGRRLQQLDTSEKKTINSPESAAALFLYEMQALEQEHLRVALLDTRNHHLQTVEIYRGSVNTAQIRAADVFKPAVRHNCTAVIVAHNHPSGDPTPSPDDIAVTRELIKAGELIDIRVLDHIVVGKRQYVSMKERGLGFA